MATVKIKFRPSTIDGGQGSIFYQVIHNRVARQKKTGYRLYANEWAGYLSEELIPKFDEGRRNYLSDINIKIRDDIRLLNKIIDKLECDKCDYTADDVIGKFIVDNTYYYLFSFMESIIENMRELGKVRTSETYSATLSSFKRFRANVDVAMVDIDSDLMFAYEAFLKANNVRPNSVSFYMRNLRAVYNRAVARNLTPQRYPFKGVYTGLDKTVKRAVPLKIIKQIKNLELASRPALDFARDMFLFSFYTRGMSFVDMAYLQKRDLRRGVLSYYRRKTGQQLFIKWEKCMLDIVDKYDSSQSKYLLPIINPFRDVDERKQYIYTGHNINSHLKVIGAELGLSVALTMYVARHSWASIAKSKNVPLSVISDGLGHDSETTTRIYLASLDTEAVDKANSMILKSL